MKKIVFCLLLVTFTLSACNLPRQSQTPSPEDVATQVNQLLTSIPTLTQAPTATQSPPTATPEPTVVVPTASPTLAPTATSVPPSPTTSAADPRVTLGEPTRKDNMSDGGSFFAYSDEHVKFDPEDDAMLMLAYEPNNWHGWSLSGTVLKDGYVEMTAKPGACSGLDQYGLMLRSPDTVKGYFFGFSCDGKYSMRKWDGKEYLTIVDWKASDKIVKGADQTNRVGIKMAGSHFTFYANGALIGEADDSTYTEGKFGLFVAASATPNFTVIVDEVDYWVTQ